MTPSLCFIYLSKDYMSGILRHNGNYYISSLPTFALRDILNFPSIMVKALGKITTNLKEKSGYSILNVVFAVSDSYPSYQDILCKVDKCLSNTDLKIRTSQIYNQITSSCEPWEGVIPHYNYKASKNLVQVKKRSIAKSLYHALINCAKMSELVVMDIVNPFSLTSPKEDCCLVNIGYSTTEYAVFESDNLIDIGFIPYGYSRVYSKIGHLAPTESKLSCLMNHFINFTSVQSYYFPCSLTTQTCATVEAEFLNFFKSLNIAVQKITNHQIGIIGRFSLMREMTEESFTSPRTDIGCQNVFIDHKDSSFAPFNSIGIENYWNILMNGYKVKGGLLYRLFSLAKLK